MPPAATRLYGGRTAEQRASHRRTAFIDAATELIAEHGWRQLTAEGVSQRSGVNKRYFYECFADVDALAAAVIDHLAAGVRDALDHAIGSATATATHDQAHDVIAALVHHFTDQPARARVLFGELGGTETTARFRETAIHAITSYVLTRAEEVHGQSDPPDPIGALTASMLVGGSGRAILDWLDGHVPMTRDELIDDLTALWVILGDGAVQHAIARQPASALKARHTKHQASR